MNESELKAAHAVVIEHYRALREHDRDAMDVTLHPNFLFVSPWGKVYKKPEYLEIFFK